jgi:hypothetical protein
MIARTVKAGVLLAVISCSATSVVAHHSFGAEYDVQRPLSLTGVVAKVEWTNPHSHIYLDVADRQGGVVNWKLEGYPITVLARNGWRRNVTLKPGDRVTVTGWGARDGGAWGHSREVMLPSGEKLFFGPPAGTGDGGATPAVEVR